MDVRTLRQHGAAAAGPAQSVVRVAGVQPYSKSADALCVATDNHALRRSPKLFHVAESVFRPISTASELLSERPILLFVGAERCVHCRKLWQLLAHDKLRPLIAALDTRYLDADQYQELATTLGVRGLPTLLVLKQGQPAARGPEPLSVENLLDWLKNITG